MVGGLDFLDLDARMYDPKYARIPNPDPLAEVNPRISPNAFCSNNPVNRVDPNGMLDDWYFNEEGKFLGKDELETDYVRIINQQVWDSQKSDAGVIDSEKGHSSSELFSKADISDASALSVYQHFNMTGQKLNAVNDLSPDAGNMTTSNSIRTVSYSDGSKKHIYINSTVDVNIAKNRGEISDHAYNIISSFEHEFRHVMDAQTRPGWFQNSSQPDREKSAIQYQRSSPTFLKTTELYRQGIEGYWKKNK